MTVHGPVGRGHQNLKLNLDAVIEVCASMYLSVQTGTANDPGIF